MRAEGRLSGAARGRDVEDDERERGCVSMVNGCDAGRTRHAFCEAAGLICTSSLLSGRGLLNRHRRAAALLLAALEGMKSRK